MAVSYSGRCTGLVTNLTVKRDGTKITGEWKIPAYMKDENSGTRAGYVDCYVYMDRAGYTPVRVDVWSVWDGSDYRLGYRTKDEFTAADRFWIKGVGLVTTEYKPYDRNRYHPVTNGAYCSKAEFGVFGGNWSTRFGYGDVVWATYKFELPRNPVLEDPSVDTGTGIVSCSITSDEGKDEHERYDTRYRVLRRDNFNAKYKNFVVVKDWVTTKDLSMKPEADVTEAQSMSRGQWVEIKFEAYSRGMAGDTSVVSKSHVYAYPAQATITGINISSIDASGIITVKVNTRNSTYAPVDSIQLQRLRNVSYTTADEAAMATGWEDVSNATDNGTSSGLSDLVPNAKPDKNKRTWYRIVSKRDGLLSYSVPVEATALYQAETAEDDTVGIISIRSIESGDGAYVTVGWPNDDSTGTEISWSEYSDAWTSTSQPSTQLVPNSWKDATSSVEGHDNTATLTVYGLYEGVDYYFKARRYHESEDVTDYGNYATAPEGQYPFKPASKPSDVHIVAPSYLARGKDLEVSWTFVSGTEQSSWGVFKAGENKVVLASGNDSLGRAKISADKFADSGDSVDIYVSMTTGSDWTDSETVKVNLVDPPNVKAVVSTPFLVQPLNIYCSSDTGDDTLIVKIYSMGVTVSCPDRNVSQLYGDVVWSGKISPGWTINEEDGLYYTVVTLPTELEFYDLAYYRLSVTAVNNTSGLESAEQLMDFQVHWIHQADRPGRATRAVGSLDSKFCEITVAKPENFEDGDVYDVYRVTPDGAYCIAKQVDYDTVVTDRYAPYSKITPLVYRIVNRTPDGDFSWIDVPYNINGYQLRFDWGDNFVELPYNLEQNESYSKDFELRTHLDGSRAGFWNLGTGHKASLSTEMVRLSDPEQVRLVRELAQYAGPVFVRTPDGEAFQANVDVTGLDRSYDSLTISASFDAEEVDLTDAYRVGHDDIVYPITDDPLPEVIVELDRSQILQWSNNLPTTGDEYEMFEDPYGETSVTLQSSYDRYASSYKVAATVEDRKVVLGEFSQDLVDYLAEAAASGAFQQYLVTIRYNIAPSLPEEIQNGGE